MGMPGPGGRAGQSGTGRVIQSGGVRLAGSEGEGGVPKHSRRCLREDQEERACGSLVVPWLFLGCSLVVPCLFSCRRGSHGRPLQAGGRGTAAGLARGYILRVIRPLRGKSKDAAASRKVTICFDAPRGDAIHAGIAGGPEARRREPVARPAACAGQGRGGANGETTDPQTAPSVGLAPRRGGAR